MPSSMVILVVYLCAHITFTFGNARIHRTMRQADSILQCYSTSASAIVQCLEGQRCAIWFNSSTEPVSECMNPDGCSSATSYEMCLLDSLETGEVCCCDTTNCNMIEEYDANTEDSQDGNESATQKLLESSDVSQESTFSPLAASSITVPSGGSEMPVLADISDQSSTSSSLMETPVSDSSVLTTQSPQAAKSEPSARPQSSTEPVPVTEPNVLVAPQPTAEPLPSEELPFPFAEPSSVSEIVEELIPFLEQPSVIEQMPELLNISAIGPEFIPFSDPEPLEEPEAEPSNFTEPFTISEPEPAVALTPTDEPPLVTQPEPTPEISIPAETEPSEEPAAELEPALSSDTGPEPEQAFEPEPTGEPQPPVSNSSMEPLVESTSTASQAIQPDAVTSVVAEPPVEMSPTSPSSVEGEGSSTTEQQTEMSTPAQSPKQPENNSACHISVLIPLCLTFFTALLLNAPK